MAKFIMVASSSGKDGHVDEYVRWADEVHVPDVCEVPGVVSGRRYVAHPGTPVVPTNLFIYEIEADDPMSVMAEIGRRVQSGEMKMTDALDPTGSSMTVYAVPS